MTQFPEKLEGLHVHLVGAKGTGMTALAEILKKRGAILTGSACNPQRLLMYIVT